LYFDGSTEQRAARYSLVLLDSRSGHILESSMVASENHDTVKSALKKVHEKYGDPLTVISDLRLGFVSACIEVFGKEVKHILCHFHFLRTFKGEFNRDHPFIKETMTKKWRLQEGLSKQLKGLGELKTKKGYPKKLKAIAQIQEYWDTTADTLGAYRYTLRWILNYKQDSTGKDRRLFLYVPFMHSESAVVHEVAIQLFSDPDLGGSLKFEEMHKRIIDRFGRYPHRNEILGRESTSEEIEFLKKPESSF